MKSLLKQQFMKLKKQKKSPNGQSQTSKMLVSVNQQSKNVKKSSSFVNKTKQQKKNNMFSNISFCMPYLDIDLTKKQREIISKQIKDKGGIIVQYHEDLYFQPIEYILVSPKSRVSNIQKKVQQKLNYLDILDYNYVQCCIAEGQKIESSRFSLLRKQREEQSERQEEKGSLKKKKRKVSDDLEDSQFENRSLTQQLPELPEEEENKSSQKKQRKLDKNKFFCQTGKQQNKPAMNKFIEDELLQLQKIYANQRDIGRQIAYGKAASLVRTFKEEIKTQQDVSKIPGIGPKIKQKIQQLVRTGKLQKLEELNQSQQVVAMGQLSKIWGIGPAKAKQLYKQGIKTIEDLQKKQNFLTRNQKIGLKYHEDFQKRIPRQKVARMFEFVRKTLNSITKNPQSYRAQACGSYRRGKQTCGDMDIIITRNDGVFQKDLLVKLVNQLQKVGFLTDNLSEPKCDQGHISTSYMGVCKYEDETHHRIDIKHYPLQQYAFALLYFTGSGMFNRSMRLFATKLGLQLSDKGFVRRPQKGEVYWNKPIPICYNEEDIFNVLGLEYRSPKQRDD